MSLRTRLLLFAVALVTLPGVVFVVIAFSGARQAMQREVGIQLQQTAERAARTLGSALDSSAADARSWIRQDVMRDLVVGDLDKRVSRFLQTVSRSESAYLDAVCTDPTGRVVAASSGDWIHRDLHPPDGNARGPYLDPVLGRPVVAFSAAIPDPDANKQSLGWLFLFYDWEATGGLIEDVRGSLRQLGKSVAVTILDRRGSVIGGVDFDGAPAVDSALASRQWSGSGAEGYETVTIEASSNRAVDVLVGSAALHPATEGWSVAVIERTSEALAPIASLRRTWTIALVAILAIGTGVALVLGRQFMQPIEEVTRTTAMIAAHPDQPMPSLPVRSDNEVGQLARSFNRMTSELKRSQAEALTAEKFAFAGELAAMVAHEVRTPLTVMRSSAQILANPEPRASVDRTELAQTIVTEVDRVNRVVDGLIQLAKPVENRIAPTPLHDPIERAVEFTRPHAAKKNIRIDCELDRNAPPALCDGEQIYQVSLNLIVNALQALGEGGTVRIRSLDPGPSAVGFTVADDGPGLPPHIRDNVFQPFVTGREEGTGLGLAFVERVVKANRGSVTVTSRDGGGTTFAIAVPSAEGPT